MAFCTFAGAEAGAAGAPGSGVYQGITANDAIIASPGAFPGAYSYSVDPVGGTPVLENYGFQSYLPDAPTFLTAMFMFRFTDTGGQFDDEVGIAELGKTTAGGSFARRLVLNTDEKIQIVDKDEDTVEQTAINYVAIDTDYWFLWYFDGREDANSRDILWAWKAGAWDKALDTTGHGDTGLSVNTIEAITFGTSYGKSLPTQGGPCYYDEMAVQVLNKSPNTTPIGSVTTVFKVPKANGTDGDFDTGTGTNPDWNDVKEIPPDGVTSYDEADTTGDQQSYEPDDADGGDTPLAIQIVGQGARNAGVAAVLKNYLLESSTYDYTDDWNTTGVGYRVLRGALTVMKTYNEVNGKALTEALFNTLEVGVEAVSLGGGETFRLSQIGLEYMKEGPKAIPGDFPTTSVATITTEAAGAALGSANPIIF